MKQKKSHSSKDISMKRSLTNTHIQLIALGGTIGTGLFLGVGNSIELAGPAVILIYTLVGFFLFLLMRALGELILSDLNKNTYIDFITQYLGKVIGTVTGYLYWFSWLSLGMAELTALGLYFRYWWHDLPLWLPGSITLIILLMINLISAKVFGNMEFSFAIIKILTIVAFVLLVFYLLITNGSTKLYGAISFSNLFKDGGFFAKGANGFFSGFQMVIFSFIGVELIGLTAAEAQDPKKTIVKAINELPVRIILFYVLAILAILLVIPWKQVAINDSPFVQALGATGIKNAACIINFVVISAAISSTNTFIYSGGRLLFSLNYHGKSNFAKCMGQLNKRQLPENALLFSTLLIGIAPIMNLFLENAFHFIAATSTSMFLIIWSIMIWAHIRYRKQTPEKQLHNFRMPLYPYTDYLVLGFFITMIGLLLWVPKDRIPMISALVIFSILILSIKFIKKIK
ncbi:MAG: amino acid permease [Lactobacillus iners]|jgi:putative D-serine/D-alanine/glycine transporter|uniref:amino acid permease n=1 Tax=Lactobacillus iners TaxID=147802 RepID=UPI0001E9B02E|nr:amino acid permease [Lactobacillus iners]EFQ49193.1 amino acid permease [Lactobacillus iners LEAF 2052A-d]MCT7781395.1 amino acid permease [Lactobacillus iners]MCT7834064.1 amino acid permease [Lactobacillus iners]MCT7885525.1 amino acid permease [Lactobacillus iners]